MARAARCLQITLSAASVTLGVTAVWLLLTFLFGRIYCSTACPVGTLSDIFLQVRRRIPRLNRPFRYRHRSRLAIHILWIYVLSLIAGISVVPFIIEPWNIASNMAATANPAVLDHTWATISLGSLTGIIVGVASLLLIAVSSILHGREFCSRYCPLGTGLGFIQERALMHIEIDPDRCIGCGLCEQQCRTQAIKHVSRYIDESRCVRCFDCVANCPQGAIRYQINRNRPATPLFRKAKTRN